MGKDSKKSNNGGKGNRKHHQKQKAGPPSKRDKAVLKIGPPPNPNDSTSIKMTDSDGNEVKERLPNYTDNENPAIALTQCEKAISLCNVYELYDNDGSWKCIVRAQHRALTGDCKDFMGELITELRDWKNNGKAKHKKMCQKLCCEIMGNDAYNNQKDAMRAGLAYQGHDHHDMAKKLWKINDSLEFMAEEAKKFTVRELCCEIIPSMLKPRAEE